MPVTVFRRGPTTRLARFVPASGETNHRRPKRDKHSLFAARNSLQRSENSLFHCTGNLRKFALFQQRSKRRRQNDASFARKFPADSLFIREFAPEQSSILTAHTASQHYETQVAYSMLRNTGYASWTHCEWETPR